LADGVAGAPVVLVVDDSMTMRRIMIDALRSFAEARVHEAASAEEALEFLRASGADLVLLDWHLPGMSGLDLIVKMQADARLARIPVVMVTSEREKANVIAALRAGARNYIVKPFTQPVFRKKVGPFLEAGGRALEETRGRLVGNLAQTSPLEVVQLISMTRKTGVLEMEGSGGRFSLYFENGNLVHAEGGETSGEEAFAACAALSDGTFTFKAEAPAHPISVRRPTNVILLEQLSKG